MRVACAWLVVAVGAALSAQTPARPIVLENLRIVDGSGGPAIERGRIVIENGAIVRIGSMETAAAPADGERIDLSGKTVIPGLIDLHFHIENDPKLALRQLSNGVTAFRDPGQWDEKFAELRRMIAADGLPGPRIFTTGPHIDGENPAYPLRTRSSRATPRRRAGTRSCRSAAARRRSRSISVCRSPAPAR
jgi:imidazolonepropionase-like amidohydrolase